VLENLEIGSVFISLGLIRGLAERVGRAGLGALGVVFFLKQRRVKPIRFP